jgi:hypothetical protein
MYAMRERRSTPQTPSLVLGQDPINASTSSVADATALLEAEIRRLDAEPEVRPGAALFAERTSGKITPRVEWTGSSVSGSALQAVRLHTMSHG